MCPLTHVRLADTIWGFEPPIPRSREWIWALDNITQENSMYTMMGSHLFCLIPWRAHLLQRERYHQD